MLSISDGSGGPLSLCPPTTRATISRLTARSPPRPRSRFRRMGRAMSGRRRTGAGRNSSPASTAPFAMDSNPAEAATVHCRSIPRNLAGGGGVLGHEQPGQTAVEDLDARPLLTGREIVPGGFQHLPEPGVED